MGKRLNLVGEKFGRLTVIEDVGNDKWGNSRFICKCDCGIERMILGCYLRSGHTKSCGCCIKKMVSETHRSNLVGQRYGRLLVLEDIGNKNSHSYWKCLCNCGTEINVVGSKLKNNHTQSCGCYNREKSIEKMSKINKNRFGKNHPFYGKHHTEETKQKMSVAQKGEKHNNWKGGITPQNELIRSSVEYKNWRKQVFMMDNYTCQLCGQCGGDLEAHHIYLFATYPKLRLNVTNGITLCKKCHEKIRGKEHQFINQFLDITLKRLSKKSVGV